jgi:hypothetical protein
VGFVTAFTLVPGGTWLRLLVGPTFFALQDIEFLEPPGTTTSGGPVAVTVDQYSSSLPYYLRTPATVVPGIAAPGFITYPLSAAAHCELWCSPARTLQMRLRP